MIVCGTSKDSWIAAEVRERVVVVVDSPRVVVEVRDVVARRLRVVVVLSWSQDERRFVRQTRRSQRHLQHKPEVNNTGTG